MFITPRMRLALLLLFLGYPAFLGCYSLKVEDAFKGEFSTVENNKIINEYCQSCHIHREFDPGKHVVIMRTKYRRNPYRKASDCRICHYVKPIWGREELSRKTRYPLDVNRGRFKDFEKKERKRIKK